MSPTSPDRFDRQVRFGPLGPAGQARLQEARVLVVGAGALGGILAQSLVRAGIGSLVIADRDVVELTNLPRQVLFEDRHAQEATPKALAAAETLGRIGGPTSIEPHAVHVEASNLPELAAGADLVLDGTDNLTTRYLVNDYCIREELPWVYGGVVSSGGLVLPILPGKSACLRCVFPEPPPAGSLPTCDTAGVILPAVGAIASLQAGAALRILGADPEAPAFQPKLMQLDVWSGAMMTLEAPRREDCPACGRHEFDFLEAPAAREPVVLCGRNAVQVASSGPRPDLAAIAARCRGVADEVQELGVMLRIQVEGSVLTLFPDGRALIEGTSEVDRARALFDRYLGS
jgi:adenylyltransferase/sulfurtransferase